MPNASGSGKSGFTSVYHSGPSWYSSGCSMDQGYPRIHLEALGGELKEQVSIVAGEEAVGTVHGF